MESPARTAAILAHLEEQYGADSVQFYDMNFFMREDHAKELAERMTPLGSALVVRSPHRYMSRYSDQTLECIRRAGCTMIFFGAESGSDWVLKEMEKQITTEQTIGLGKAHAATRHHPGILICDRKSEGSRAGHARDAGVHPQDQEAESKSEIIMYHYTPVPQRGATYGDIMTNSFSNYPRSGAPRINFTLHYQVRLVQTAKQRS